MVTSRGDGLFGPSSAAGSKDSFVLLPLLPAACCVILRRSSKALNRVMGRDEKDRPGIHAVRPEAHLGCRCVETHEELPHFMP